MTKSKFSPSEAVEYRLGGEWRVGKYARYYDQYDQHEVRVGDGSTVLLASADVRATK